jgi:UDP-N-acetylmuramate dehydrogenase
MMIDLDLQAALQTLGEKYGARLGHEVPLSRYSAARLGGPAQALLEVQTKDELVDIVSFCWREGFPFTVLGDGSNILVSDAGVRGLVIINRARQIHFDEQSGTPLVRAESGANFGLLARQAAQRGLAGMEWAAGIPGTLGGAIVGNAGAHGGELSHHLRMALILHRNDAGQKGEVKIEEWPVEKLDFSYRSSILKRAPGRNIVLAGLIQLERGNPQVIREKMDELVAYRRRTQPPGASTGSMFKNPPGDFAGRLIDAAGLKGARVGDAQISPLHANFFINLGNASAADFYALIEQARRVVAEKFAVQLELEVELIGEW